MALRPLLSTEMAKITFSDVGKAATQDAKEAVRFLFAHTDFELARDASTENDDPEVIAGASAHPWLQVETDTSDEQQKTAAAQAEAVANSTDPHVNPAVDHLSSLASPEVVAEAEKANADSQAADVPAAAPVAPAPTPVAPSPQFSSTPTEEHPE